MFTTDSTRGHDIPQGFLLALLVVLAAVFLMNPEDGRATTIDFAAGILKATGTEGPDDLAFSNGGGGFDDDPSRIKVYGGEGSSLTAAAALVCTGRQTDEQIFEENVWHCPRPSKVVVALLGGNDYLSAYENGDLPFTIPLEVEGGEGEDRIDGGSGNDILRGGAGNDHLTGRGGDDRIYGEGGNDTLNGDFTTEEPGGDDLLDGGAGDDEFEKYVGVGYPAGLQGDDTYIGGAGNDSFSYFQRDEPVEISLDQIANDGVVGEADNIHADIESVGGGGGADLIIGSPGDDYLWGGAGDDRIFGGDGNDRLQGDSDADHIDGGPGDDELDGGCMTDVLVGGPGRDSFNSDGACGWLLRSPLDRIEARDGEMDRLIFCQRDTDETGDTAVVDPFDPVTKSGAGACGTVLVGQGNDGSKPPKGQVRAKLGPNLKLIVGDGGEGSAATQRIDTNRNQLVLGTLFTSKKATAVIGASVLAARKSVSLGLRKVTVPAGRSKVLTIALSPRSKSILKGKTNAAVKVRFNVGKKAITKRFRVPINPGKTRCRPPGGLPGQERVVPACR